MSIYMITHKKRGAGPVIAKQISFQMRFGLSLPGFAMTPDAIDYYPGCKPEGASGPSGNAPADQEFLLTMEEKDGAIKGVLKSEHGCQKIDDIVESDFSISFTAYAGSEGVDIFRFVLMFSDSTPQIVGYAAGTKPCFRSFMPLCGRVQGE